MPLADTVFVPQALSTPMRVVLRLLTILAAAALLAGCATSADETWIHPATGRIQTIAPQAN